MTTDTPGADGLPPLPKPCTLSRGDEDGAICLGYSADQMRAYAAAAVREERDKYFRLTRYMCSGGDFHEFQAAEARRREAKTTAPDTAQR